MSSLNQEDQALPVLRCSIIPLSTFPNYIIQKVTHRQINLSDTVILSSAFFQIIQIMEKMSHPYTISPKLCTRRI